MHTGQFAHLNSVILAARNDDAAARRVHADLPSVVQRKRQRLICWRGMIQDHDTFVMCFLSQHAFGRELLFDESQRHSCAFLNPVHFAPLPPLLIPSMAETMRMRAADSIPPEACRQGCVLNQQSSFKKVVERILSDTPTCACRWKAGYSLHDL